MKESLQCQILIKTEQNTSDQDDANFQNGQPNVETDEGDKEYYRPSYMFHWLKVSGWQTDEAYQAFENFKGKASYEELGLEAPTPMAQEEDDSEWLHMSDYDNMGDAPIECQDSLEDLSEDAVKTQHCNRFNKVQNHASEVRNDYDHVEDFRAIRRQEDDAHEVDHRGDDGAVLGIEGKENSNHQHEPMKRSGRVEKDPNHDDHDETCRDAKGHEATIHEKSDERSMEALTLQHGEAEEMVTNGVWCRTKQAYTLKVEWSRDGEGHVASFMLGGSERYKRRKQRRESVDSEDSEDEEDQLVCNMTGENWEELPFFVIIDSGACASVMPVNWCPHVDVMSTLQPRAREFFRAAYFQLS